MDIDKSCSGESHTHTRPGEEGGQYFEGDGVGEEVTCDDMDMDDIALGGAALTGGTRGTAISSG
jgi:hypothetical protein